MTETETMATNSTAPEIPAPETTASDARTTPRKRGRILPVLAVLAIMIALAGIFLPGLSLRVARYFTAPHESVSGASEFRPEYQTPPSRTVQAASNEPAPAIADTSLSARIAALEERASQDETSGLSVATLTARIDALQTMMAEKTDLAALAARIETLEAANAGTALHRAALALALSELAQAAREAKPFTVELAALNAASPNDPIVRMLSPYAASGVPSLAGLTQSFPAHARSALQTERGANAQGFFGRLWTSIASMVSIRRIDGATGSSSEDILARAQQALDRADLTASLNEVRQLRGVSAEAMTSWRRDAEARASLDAALSQIGTRVVEALNPPTPATSSLSRAPAAQP